MNIDYEPVIGLEVHIQLKTAAKLFCGCSTGYGASENSHICPVCTGYPGSLPVLNKGALSLALRMALGLQCRINPKIIFERKNYFYPDLPKNYQISQYALPLGSEGSLTIYPQEKAKKIRILRVHMEEDAGKLVHGQGFSCVDFNRTGIPLAEIVTYPDIASPDEAYEYLTALKMIARHLGVSECDMEKGFLRCDANVSIREKGVQTLGVKTELKNMNSFKNVRDALEYEIGRQKSVIKKGGSIVQSTLLWDDQSRKTAVMRTKEEAHDYRYFPDPDLVIFEVDQAYIEDARAQLPPMPEVLKAKLRDSYGLSSNQSELLLQEPWLVAFFMAAVDLASDPKKLYNFMAGPLLECVNAAGKGFSDVRISPVHFAGIVRMLEEGQLNNLTGKELLRQLVFTDGDPRTAAAQKGLIQVSGENELQAIVETVIKNHPKPVSDFLQGKEQALMFLIGQVMKEMKGKANPKVVRELFERRIRDV